MLRDPLGAAALVAQIEGQPPQQEQGGRGVQDSQIVLGGVRGQGSAQEHRRAGDDLTVLYAAAALFLLGGLAFYLRHQHSCTQRIAQHRRALEGLKT